MILLHPADTNLIVIGEQYINSQLNDHLHEFHRQQDLLAQAKNHYRHCSTGITEKSQQLAQITAELTRIKEEMEETGQNVTDGGLNFLFFFLI
jgi:estrogen-related receptor beta like 1